MSLEDSVPNQQVTSNDDHHNVLAKFFKALESFLQTIKEEGNNNDSTEPFPKFC